jgi:16S rRNA (uracil1498-N3)-methyltransferase
MRANFRLQRLFVGPDLGPEAAIELEKDHSNYLLNVLRLAEGAELLVFNVATANGWPGLNNRQRKRPRCLR